MTPSLFDLDDLDAGAEPAEEGPLADLGHVRDPFGPYAVGNR